MNKSSAILALLLAVFTSTCSTVLNINEVRGSGKIVSENRSIQGVQGVSLEMSGQLTVKLGDQESLVVTGDDNLMQYIETNVNGGTLTIHQPNNTNLRPSETLRYELTVKSLNSLATSSSGSISAPTLQANQMHLDVSSSGGIQLAGIQANTLLVNISSSGDVKIDQGQTQDQTITISSSGNYEAGSVQSQSANINISSSGSATVWVTENLNSNISSSGNVNFYGNPNVSQQASSNGKLVSLGNK
jgi:hypothetical protein